MTSMTGNDGDLWKGNIMLNMVAGKWLMVHVDECDGSCRWVQAIVWSIVHWYIIRTSMPPRYEDVQTSG